VEIIGLAFWHWHFKIFWLAGKGTFISFGLKTVMPCLPKCHSYNKENKPMIQKTGGEDLYQNPNANAAKRIEKVIKLEWKSECSQKIFRIRELAKRIT
jgi:hypothetical protein